MAEAREHTAQLGDVLVHWRSAPATGTPALYVHGVPNASEMWREFLAATGGIAVDLPGFGRSGKRGDLDYSIAGYDAFMERFADHLELDRVDLVVHDWGGAALAWAQRQPERVRRLVLIDAVPLLGGYRWHRMARLWRTPVIGELVMGATSARTLRLLSREGNPGGGPRPSEFIEEILEHFDQGTQRAILRLYRSAPPSALEEAGRELHRLGGPSLVLWGDRDPYLPIEFAHAYGDALAHATVEVIADAGHWPWLDDPSVVTRVADFLGEE